MYPTLSDYQKWYQNHQKKIVEDFCTFLSFPSISADPAYKSELLKCAEWLQNYLRHFGLKTTLWHSSGYPALFAESDFDPKRPTLLLYHHYDVQPVDPVELWKSDPFKPTIRHNQVFARGACDNKGQCIYSLAAVNAYLELAKKLGINIKIFIEGEEESGGKGTNEIIEKHKKELKADYLFVVDSSLVAPGVGTITLGVRGIVTFELLCRNSEIDLHSGSHGGIVLNPNHALIRALAKLWTPTGKIAIPHFYDDIVPMSEKEKAKLDMSFDHEEYVKQFGVKAFAPEPGFSLMESNRLRPTLEINGIAGGYAGKGFKTVIPAEAQAKVSCRLVPDQDPDKIAKHLADFLKKQFPEEIQFEIKVHHGARAFRSRFDSDIAKTTAKAYEEVLEQPCRYLFMGGSIPIIGDLSKASHAETILMGYGLEDDHFHAPNEHFGIDRLQQGFLTMGRIFSLLSEK